MADDGISEIIKAIARLETKMDTVIQRLGENDQRFQRVEERLRKLEQTDERMMGMGVVLMIAIPILLSALMNTLMRIMVP